MMKSTLFLSLVFVASVAMAEEEKAIPVIDSGEGTRCDKDISKAQSCFLCTRLPNGIDLKLTDCCMEDEIFDLCEQCLKKPAECLAKYNTQMLSKYVEYFSLDEDENDLYRNNDEDPEEKTEVEKRYGRLFFGKGRRRSKFPTWYRLKRWGTFHLGTGNSRNRYFGKRGSYGDEDDDNDDEYGGYGDTRQTLEKRFGRLFMSSYRPFGKRYGALFLGRNGRR